MIPSRTESVHIFGLMNSAAKEGMASSCSARLGNRSGTITGNVEILLASPSPKPYKPQTPKP